jgi:hypothetical protein
MEKKSVASAKFPPKRWQQQLLRKEARKIEIFKSDHDCGRTGYCFGTRVLC